jgi:hypothetical protein
MNSGRKFYSYSESPNLIRSYSSKTGLTKVKHSLFLKVFKMILRRFWFLALGSEIFDSKYYFSDIFYPSIFKINEKSLITQTKS